MEIYYSPKFVKKYKKLPQDIKKQAVLQEKLFLENPYNLKIKTHKLSGVLDGLWSFSINNQYRIIFEFKDKNTVHFHTVGTHDVYKTTSSRY